MKVIFLDFDGVLNSRSYNCTYGDLIDPSRMTLLKELVDATDAKIVLSTSWREHWDCDREKCDSTGEKIRAIFDEAGIAIIGKTPRINNERDCEIKTWLKEHPDTDAYVVIDDMPMELCGFDGHFVLTSNLRRGLDEDDVRKAIRILNGE